MVAEGSANGTRLLAAFGPGSRLAGYLLEEQIGAGGMAVVFRAVDERLGRRVALKILAPGLASDQVFRQRFTREWRAAAAVDDPYIIPVHDAGEAEGVLFIAMRLVPSKDVRTLVHEQGPLPPARVAAIIAQVASALDAAHAAGLVHRDVKPANMLIDIRPGRADHVYLADFGISKGATFVGLTGTGQFLGSPDYIAPEQIQGRDVDGRADQYALACAAFELLAGAPPFQRDQGMAIIWAHLSEPPPSLCARIPGLPAAVDIPLATAMAKEPQDRFPSCQEFAAALSAALGIQPHIPRVASSPTADEAVSDSRRPPEGEAVTETRRPPGDEAVTDAGRPPEGEPMNDAGRPPEGETVTDSRPPPGEEAPTRGRGPARRVVVVSGAVIGACLVYLGIAAAASWPPFGVSRAQAALSALIPQSIKANGSCKATPPPSYAYSATAAFRCIPQGNVAFFVNYYLYPSRSTLNYAYRNWVTVQAGTNENSGSCGSFTIFTRCETRYSSGRVLEYYITSDGNIICTAQKQLLIVELFPQGSGDNTAMLHWWARAPRPWIVNSG
jgi:serine/threonine-protein kinase